MFCIAVLSIPTSPSSDPLSQSKGSTRNFMLVGQRTTGVGQEIFYEMIRAAHLQPAGYLRCCDQYMYALCRLEISKIHHLPSIVFCSLFCTNPAPLASFHIF